MPRPPHTDRCELLAWGAANHKEQCPIRGSIQYLPQNVRSSAQEVPHISGNRGVPYTAKELMPSLPCRVHCCTEAAVPFRVPRAGEINASSSCAQHVRNSQSPQLGRMGVFYTLRHQPRVLSWGTDSGPGIQVHPPSSAPIRACRGPYTPRLTQFPMPSWIASVESGNFRSR